MALPPTCRWRRPAASLKWMPGARGVARETLDFDTRLEALSAAGYGGRIGAAGGNRTTPAAASGRSGRFAMIRACFAMGCIMLDRFRRAAAVLVLSLVPYGPAAFGALPLTEGRNGVPTLAPLIAEVTPA